MKAYGVFSFSAWPVLDLSYHTKLEQQAVCHRDESLPPLAFQTCATSRLNSPVAFALPLVEKTPLLDLPANFLILQGALALEVELPSGAGVP